MYNQPDIKYFRKTLLAWFEVNKRDFPWRKDYISAYELIFSEILLQRTKAETVAKYYNTFFGTYPDWEELKAAKQNDLEDILKPLGLYRQRTKRLLRIIKEYKDRKGLLPKDGHSLRYSSISTLYLSAAYKLIILKKNAALLDVNMARVLNRFFNPRELKDIRDDKLMHKLAEHVTNINKCKELNWAILDFGALICKTKPKCLECKLNDRCGFYNNNL